MRYLALLGSPFKWTAIIVYELFVLATAWLGIPIAVIGAAMCIGQRAWWGLALVVWLASMSVACMRSTYPDAESMGDLPYSPGGP